MISQDGWITIGITAGAAIGGVLGAWISRRPAKKDPVENHLELIDHLRSANTLMMDEVKALWQRVNELQAECDDMRDSGAKFRAEHEACRGELERISSAYETLREEFKAFRDLAGIKESHEASKI